jgi:peptidoglycan hydrolase-like protein with peptidoglycan-binding domain
MTNSNFERTLSSNFPERFKAMNSQTYDRSIIQAAPDLNSGDIHPSIVEVQNYLKHYGYLMQDTAFSPGQLDKVTTLALTAFQQRFNIVPSGNLDAATRASMATSRCGVPDIVSPLDFKTIGAWNRRNLTYTFGSLSAQIDNDVARNAIRRAFNTWEGAGAGLTFTEVSQSQNPDIFIEWRQATDPDHSMVGGILAHAAFRELI